MVYMAVFSVCMELFNLYTNFAIHNKLQPVLETTRSYKLPTYTEAVHREPLTSTSVQRVILAFPYNGERVPVARRLAQSPHALYVVSESPYGHNGLLNQMHWHEDFPTHRAEYMRLREKLFNTSSPDSTWSQESMARIILGQGVHNMYARGEISDNDMVVVTDADEVVSPEALAWLQMHLRVSRGTRVATDASWWRCQGSCGFCGLTATNIRESRSSGLLPPYGRCE